MRVAAVILAAGASTRLGQPKQLVRLGEERMLERAIRVACEACCDPILVVLGSSADAIQREVSLDGVVVVINPDWQTGMASSIGCGVRKIPTDCRAAIVMTCDQPAVTAEHLARLGSQCASQAVASSYSSRRGVPACFPAEQFADLCSLSGNEGARNLLASGLAVALPGGELDIDTPQALNAAQTAYSL